MPKVKTRKSVAKRFTVTKNGKVTRQCAKARHLSTDKTRKKKRQLRGSGHATSKPDTRRVRTILSRG